MTTKSNVFEEAFMKLALKMVTVTITTDTLTACSMQLFERVKATIDSNKYDPKESIGPILSYGDIAALGPFWYNDARIQSEMVTLMVGLLIGDLMSDCIDPIDMTLPNVFSLTSSIEPNVQEAKVLVSHLLIEKFGAGAPNELYESADFESKLLELLRSMVDREVATEQELVDHVNEVNDIIHDRHYSKEDEKKGKTIH